MTDPEQTGSEHSEPDFSGYNVQFALAGQMCQAIATASEEEAEEIHESLSEIEAVEQPRVVGVGGEPEGLYEKYEVRKDGEIVEDCFVLEPESDEAAQAALATYALATDDEGLFEDLDAWLRELEFTDEAVVLAMGWTEQIVHFLEMYFTETREDAYSPTSYQSAYLARELRERAGLASKDLLDDEPDAPPAYWDEDGGESDAE